MSEIHNRFESICSKDILEAIGIQDASDVDCKQILDIIKQRMVAAADVVSCD